MIKSMTGFGKLVKSSKTCDIQIEIKSVNNRYCDICIRLPKVLSVMENLVKALVQEHLMRGKVSVSIEAKFQKPLQSPSLNRQQFVASLNVLEQMKVLGGLNDVVRLEHFLRFQDLIEYDSSPLPDDLEALVKSAVEECLAKVDEMRTAEGENLRGMIMKQLQIIDKLAGEVDDAKNDVFLYWVNRFQSRIREFAPETAEMGDRVVQEASIYAEKADIKEELARIFSHQEQFYTIMKNEYPCGKKLDFLCQEMYREWNTIASKSLKVEIINKVVEAKAAVDSIREQVQNIV